MAVKYLKFICLEDWVEGSHLFDLTGCVLPIAQVVYLLIIQFKSNY